MKMGEVVRAYKVLGNAKYQKLDDEDKVKLWKISRQLRPLTEQFEEDRKDASKNLVPQEVKETLPKALQYEKLKKEGAEKLPMTEAEYLAFAEEFEKCNNLIRTALAEVFDKEVTLTFEPLSEEVFGQLMASNDWTLGEVETLEWIVG